MQTKPTKHSHIFMTAVGLALLILALILNHYHPRNGGIANLNHGYISNLALNFSDQPQQKSMATGKPSVIFAKHSQNVAPTAAALQTLSNRPVGRTGISVATTVNSHAASTASADTPQSNAVSNCRDSTLKQAAQQISEAVNQTVANTSAVVTTTGNTLSEQAANSCQIRVSLPRPSAF